MEEENHTVLSQFLLLGLSEDPEFQPVLFGLFLSMYLVAWYLGTCSSSWQSALTPTSTPPCTEIPHFFCELAQLLKVAGSDALANNIFTYVATALLCVFPMTGILFSYAQIVSTLTRMSSIESKYKAFSTCGSHLGVISLYYGTSLLEYLSFALTHSSQGITVASVMYSVVTLMLNPFIYSLRNMDVMGPLGRLFSRAASSH
ncbi:Olfactory receptor 867 [Sciurus carolinensis]|uniref:Olfactory receptor 867 n=1 Tax=Sciurus carolinensis TaxID=30640 RepID=A0AA41MK36_SCICA|nr:Olfactory receptor 867 [Sciurus carolinensis]